jgi:putative peptidoglycan lipid II flippase
VTPEKPSSPPDFVAKAAFLFGSGTLTSRILGLIRDALLFSAMPLDMKDAWIVASRLPNFFRRLLGEGGLSVSFIPVYVGLLSPDKQLERQRLTDGVFTLLMYIVTFICLVCFVFMDAIVTHWLSGPGFTSIPGKVEMTISMGRIMVFFLFFISLFAYFMALLNGLKKFTLTGYAPMFLNIVIIMGLYLYRGSEHLASAAAWSFLIGGALQALFLVPAVYKLKVVPRLTKRILHPSVKRVILKFLPSVFGVGILQVLALVNVYFASQLSSGANSYIYLADRLLELPLSLIAVSIGTTLLPTLSQYWSENRTDTFMSCLARHVKLFQFLAIPAAFGLWFLGTDIISVLFSRGYFTQDEAPIVASIVRIYCMTLMCAGALKITSQAFFATGDTHTPAIVSALGLCLHLIMAPYWMAQYQIQGLVFSTALVTLFNLIVCSVYIQIKVGLLPWRELTSHTFRCLIAGSGMALFLWQLSLWPWRQGRFILDFPLLLLLIVLASLIYFAICAVLSIDEMKVIRRKLKI